MFAPSTQPQQPVDGQEQTGTSAPAQETETVNAATIASKHPTVAATLRRIRNI